MVNFERIATSFEIPVITNCILLTRGKTASTYLLHTNTTKKFILKSLSTKEQAYFEHKLMRHIGKKNKDIISEILITKSNEPFIELF